MSKNVRGVLGQVFSTRAATAPAGFAAPLAVERPAYYIGDIHGCFDELKRLLEIFETDAEENSCVEIVFIGDYVDRGEQSRDVLRLLHAIAEAVPDRVTMLMGNHERMLLDFLADPARKGGFWLANGGLQTLASFGIGGLTEIASASRLEATATALAERLTLPVIDWLKGLPLLHQNGNLTAVHAGANPALPLDEQPERSVIWGHPEFHHLPREDGQWVIHGHKTVVHPQIVDGRISIDTGAYYSRILSAAFVRPDAPVRFLDTRRAR